MWTQATRDQVAAIEKKTKRYPSDLKNQHEAAAGRSAVIGSKRRHHMAVGRPRPFLAALRHDRVVAPWLIDGSINGATFQLMSRRSWFRHCAEPTSSSWTISARTRARLYAESFVQPVPGSSTCQIIHLT